MAFQKLSKLELKDKLIQFIGYEPSSQKISKPFFSIERRGLFPVPQEIADEMKNIIGDPNIDASFYQPFFDSYKKYGGTIFVMASATRRVTQTPFLETRFSATTNSIAPYVIAERRNWLTKAAQRIKQIQASRIRNMAQYQKMIAEGKANEFSVNLPFVLEEFYNILLSPDAEDALFNLLSKAEKSILGETSSMLPVIMIDFPVVAQRPARLALGLQDDPKAVQVANKIAELYQRPEVKYGYISGLPKSANKGIVNLSPINAIKFSFYLASVIYDHYLNIVDSSGYRNGTITPVTFSFEKSAFWISPESRLVRFDPSRILGGRCFPTADAWCSAVDVIGMNPTKVYPSGIEYYNYPMGQSGFVTALYMYVLEFTGSNSSSGGTGNTSSGSSGGTGSEGTDSTGGTKGTASAGGASVTAPGGTFIASDWAWCVTRFPNNPARQQQCLLELQGKTERAITEPALIGSGIGLGAFLLLAIVAGGIYYFVYIYKR